MDQLRRVDAVSEEEINALNSLIEQSEALISNGSDDNNLAAQLAERVQMIREENANRRTRSADTYMALAETLEGIASRLR